MHLSLSLEMWLRPRSEFGLVAIVNQFYSVIKMITFELILLFYATVIFLWVFR